MLVPIRQPTLQPDGDFVCQEKAVEDFLECKVMLMPIRFRLPISGDVTKKLG